MGNYYIDIQAVEEQLTELIFQLSLKKNFWEHGRPVISHCDWKRKILFKV
jgi:hypothetical protein